MKYLLLIGDGMADRPDVPELNSGTSGKTPLQVAHKPNLDRLCARGVTGLARTIPPGMAAGSDIAILSILGYDPRVCYTGRGPLEAAGMGIPLPDGAVSFRCNLVTVVDGILVDHSAGGISSAEARALVEYLNRSLTGRVAPPMSFHPGVGYRHLLIISGGDSLDQECPPPHDILGRPYREALPPSSAGEFLRQLVEASGELLEKHPVNLARQREGKRPANLIWLWGPGRRPHLVPFAQRTGLQGTAISAVDVVRGIALEAGLQVMIVPGADGTLKSNFRGKVEAALQALNDGDFVLVHVEAPDDAGHEGDFRKKVRAVELFDREVVGPLVRALTQEHVGFRALVMPDHATPVALRAHTPEPVPFVLFDSVEHTAQNTHTVFHEFPLDERTPVLEASRDLFRAFLQQS